MKIGRFSGAVVPDKFRADKVIALAILLEQVTGQPALPDDFQIVYWKKNTDPSPEEDKGFTDAGLYLLDIGHRKYHAMKAPSASCVVFNDLGIKASEMPEIRRLVALANQNNRTGELKEKASGMNMPNLLVELYKAQMGIRAEAIMEASLHVVFTEIRFARLGRNVFPRKIHELGGFPKLSKLMGEITSSQDPFTISQYLFQMFVLGDEELEIQRRVEFWVAARDRAQRLREVARGKASRIERKSFLVNGHQCYHIVSDDDKVARAIFSEQNPPALIVCESRYGHVQILSRKPLWNKPGFAKSLDVLAQKLMKREVNGCQWQHHPAMHFVHCGTRSSRDSQATGNTMSLIIRTIQEEVRLPELSTAK